ncbi:MAG: hypothetical protein K9M96_01055 [Deltaproteobacteria bacterium]|nr:hypothetical protein [Deltaproteobacteria bacterium]MCF8118723.1 hypothetical protein [Deltaproteobacteria bacterium]
MRRIVRTLGADIQVFRSVTRLAERFEQPRWELSVMIFNIANQDILNDLIQLKDRMYDLPVILILPDSKRNTILKGHKLYPRFITDIESDFNDLNLVLDKILRYSSALEFSIKERAPKRIAK